jgi:hypothetical protein
LVFLVVVLAAFLSPLLGESFGSVGFVSVGPTAGVGLVSGAGPVFFGTPFGSTGRSVESWAKAAVSKSAAAAIAVKGTRDQTIRRETT